MPNNSPVLVIPGHGVCSGKGRIADYGNYRILCSVKKGMTFDVVAYNYLMGMLLSAVDSPSLERSLDLIEQLPNTVIIDKSNKKLIRLEEGGIDIGEESQRQSLELRIQEAKKLAQDSHESWELLDHQLSPADEIFKHEYCLKLHARMGYQGFVVQHETYAKARQDKTTAITSHMSFDVSYLCRDAERLFSLNKDAKQIDAKLPNNQIIHIKPFIINASGGENILLSQVLASISYIHILVRVDDTGDDDVSDSEAEIFNVFYDDFKHNLDFISAFQALDGDKIHWIDYTIPSDSNIILGSCRIVDTEF